MRVEHLSRGVKKAPYTIRGRPTLVVVDSFGNMVRQVALKPGANEMRAADWLEGWLNRTHPAPTLELVRPAGAKRVFRPVREVDPRLYADPRSPLARRRYVRGLVTNAANRFVRTGPDDI